MHTITKSDCYSSQEYTIAAKTNSKGKSKHLLSVTVINPDGQFIYFRVKENNIVIDFQTLDSAINYYNSINI